jgi:sialic acid synthase SpsE
VGPDHAASLEPEGLRRLIRNVRNIERALGDGEKRLLPEERAVRDRLAKSIVATRDIPAGTLITAEMLTTKGPGNGLLPRYIPELCGRIAEVAIDSDTLIPPEALGWRPVVAATSGSGAG